MGEERYEPLPSGIPIPCSGRLARRTALDSFDPGTWEGIERRLSLEPALVTERKDDPLNRIMDLARIENILFRRVRWLSELRVHRKECDLCKTDKQQRENAFGLDYFKGGNTTICMGIHDVEIGLCYCCYCDKELGDRETWVMEHKSTWKLRFFHAECAIKCNIVTRKEVMDSWPYITQELQKLMIKRAKNNKSVKRYKIYSLK
jgi:hypothetical protein